jgi:cytochrome c oxidase assembly protein subunit 15
MVAVVAYAQLVLGACLRHVPETATIGYFRLAVYAHLIGAGLLLVLIAMLGWRTLRGPLARTAVRWPASWLCLLLGLQLGLGCLTWIVNYLWPTFVVGTSLTTWYTLIEAKGLFPSLVMTAHQANGSLILGMSVLLALRLNVLVQSGRPATVPGAAAWGGATG